MNSQDWSDVEYDQAAMDHIEAEVRRIDGELFVVPVFRDQVESGTPRTTDTSDRGFRTALRRWYPRGRSAIPAKSELSPAAFHTHS
ncbi:MAG: hypothetical protein OXN89_00610 [Bryobacterales bacterium]|nr:hypothetical protein [Bryobacterales bacterium]